MHYSGVGKCPNVSHHPTRYWGYHVQQIFVLVMKPIPKSWDINPNPCCYLTWGFPANGEPNNWLVDLENPIYKWILKITGGTPILLFQ